MSISIIPTFVNSQALISVLGVVYLHQKTADGGDLYLTRFGVGCADLLELDNWYERSWFEQRRVRLAGTSAVYRVPTKEVRGRSIDLVVKNCRVGEDVPIDTRTLLEFINTEFNSPWEEFSLVMEIREGKYGARDITIRTQDPLAIYVPPETMQIWQSGRSVDKINRIQARHPGIDLDILRQYKLVYAWIQGRDVVEILEGLDFREEELLDQIEPITCKATYDLGRRGYVMADMKACHIIIAEQDLPKIQADDKEAGGEELRGLVEAGAYSVIDYELLARTPVHEEVVMAARRHSYLGDQRDRFVVSELPEYLKATEVMGVPYVFGRAEATGGKVWVVGRNGRLFDYFLPERWRKTHAWKLSDNSDIYYTLTKDWIHVVWKASRVGETPALTGADPRRKAIIEHGYNSPFEEFAIAHELSQKGVGAVYTRAIYVTGSTKIERSTDMRRYESHRHLVDPDGTPILCEDHNYITVRGYFNGPDWWVSQQRGQLGRPLDLDQALSLGMLDPSSYRKTLDLVMQNLLSAGFDGALLTGNDILVVRMPDGTLLHHDTGDLDARISNFELIRRLPS